MKENEGLDLGQWWWRIPGFSTTSCCRRSLQCHQRQWGLHPWFRYRRIPM